jgi:serine/threonine-protein kinase RsbW
MSERLKLRMDNRLPELDRMRWEVEKFLERGRVCGKEAHHIILALDELITNVITYAYGSQSGRFIDLSLDRRSGVVDMTIEDEGVAFNPLKAPEPDLHGPAGSRCIGGLGIHFVRKTMDDMQYERKDDKNILHIRKNITQE